MPLGELEPLFDPARGTTVLAPEADAPGYWVGAPSVRYEPDRERWVLAYRQRRPRGDVRERGFRCAVATSHDGLTFTDRWEVGKEELGTESMERFSVCARPGGGYLLFISYVDPADRRWRVDVVDGASVDSFDLGTRRPVLTAATTGTDGVKDPYLLGDRPPGMLVSFARLTGAGTDPADDPHASGDVYTTGRIVAPTGLATRSNGAAYTWHGGVLDVGTGWDAYQARLSSVVSLDGVQLGLYDGSASAAENYEECCGLAVSNDGATWRRVSRDRPWLTAPAGTGSLRYVDAVWVGAELWCYYEMARGNGSHELRCNRVPRDRVERIAESIRAGWE